MDELVNDNGTFTQDELSELKAQLEQEQKARATFEALIAEKDSAIEALTSEKNTLEAEVSRLTQDVEALKSSLSQAVSSYQDLVLASNPSIPSSLIQGNSIEEINASVDRAKGLIAQITASLEAEASRATVPVGAPARTGITTEGMSSREKIIYGLAKR